VRGDCVRLPLHAQLAGEVTSPYTEVQLHLGGQLSPSRHTIILNTAQKTQLKCRHSCEDGSFGGLGKTNECRENISTTTPVLQKSQGLPVALHHYYEGVHAYREEMGHPPILMLCSMRIPRLFACQILLHLMRNQARFIGMNKQVSFSKAKRCAEGGMQ